MVEESKIVDNLEFWRELNDMMNEKSKEVKVAKREEEKLAKCFAGKIRRRLKTLSNAFLIKNNLPLLSKIT